MNGYEQALHDFQSAFRLRSRLLRIISLGICTLLSVGIVYHLGYGVDIPSKIYSLDNAGDIQNSTLGVRSPTKSMQIPADHDINSSRKSSPSHYREGVIRETHYPSLRQ